MIIIIIPNWLKVDKAITFFISISSIAAQPAINIVNAPITINTVDILVPTNKIFIRIKRYTPAVTRVDEWTKAETGVGAAIAAGNHAEKGICALFVQAETTTITNNNHENFIVVLVINKNLQLPYTNIIEIDTSSPTSPNRLVKAVIIPALYDLFLW